jgi:CheY-like chemotaxis protein
MGNIEGAPMETVLVVDDAEQIRKMVCSMLSFSGYKCVEAADGTEALDIVKDAPDSVDLILTDIVMPEMGGPELARQVAMLRPDLPIVFMSGYSDDPVVRTLEHSPALFLPKPFTAAALTEKVRAALDRPWTGVPGAQTSSAQ